MAGLLGHRASQLTRLPGLLMLGRNTPAQLGADSSTQLTVQRPGDGIPSKEDLHLELHSLQRLHAFLLLMENR